MHFARLRCCAAAGLGVAMLAMLSSACAGAQQPRMAPVGEVLLGAGVFNVLDGGDQDGLLLSLEYRPPMALWRIRPLLSFARASGGSTFTSGGVVLGLPLGGRWEVSGGFAPTHHVPQGRQNLGHSVEFYSFAELLWRRASGAGVRARFGHISNAGLGPVNPGAEIAQLQLSMPIGTRRRH